MNPLQQFSINLGNEGAESLELNFFSPNHESNEQDAICFSLFGTPPNELEKSKEVPDPVYKGNFSSVPLLSFDEEEESSKLNLPTATHIGSKQLDCTPMTTISFEDSKFPIPNSTSRCKCKKSQCLRLHCVCFSSGGVCGPQCGCVGCVNLPQFEEARQFVIMKTKEINPTAFESKLKNVSGHDKIVNSQGCKCTRNNCKKNYCACFKNGIGCSDMCRCSSCLNSKEELKQEEKAIIGKRVFRKKHKIVIGVQMEESQENTCLKMISYVRHKKKLQKFKRAQRIVTSAPSNLSA